MIIDVCRLQKKPVIVDPKGNDYSKYQGSTLIKPNLKEFGEATHAKYDPLSKNFQNDITESALDLMNKYNIDNVVVTLSEHGMLHVSKTKKTFTHVSTDAKEVFDVSGAGDTSLAILGLSIGSGMDVKDAMLLANKASGIVVGKVGTATITMNELNNALLT